MYQAILFSPDGEDYVTDHERETVAEVWEAIDNQGSKWFFYPIPFVIRYNGGPITHNQRIIEACEPFGDLAGRTIATASSWIHSHQDLIEMVLS